MILALSCTFSYTTWQQHLILASLWVQIIEEWDDFSCVKRFFYVRVNLLRRLLRTAPDSFPIDKQTQDAEKLVVLCDPKMFQYEYVVKCKHAALFTIYKVKNE